MTNTALFSIRGLLAMVAVVAGMFAALCYANPKTLLILQTCLLGNFVVLAVLAIAGSARTRRFCVAALAAGLMHLFLCYVHPASAYGMDNESSPTLYCCNVLWNWIKVATPMSGPAGFAFPMSFQPTTIPPPASVTLQPATIPPPSSGVPTLASDSDTTANSDVAPDPLPITPPVGDLTPPPASVVVTAIPSSTPPSIYIPPPGYSVPPSYIGASPSYVPPSLAMPVEYKPDWPSFAQIGIIDATLLIGMVAGCAAVMLDQSRRRALRNRTTNRTAQIAAARAD